MEHYRCIEYQSQSIYYVDAGEGPVLVLLHGFTETLEIWQEFFKNLPQSLRVICIDLPGHGRTGSFGPVHTMKLMAETVHAVLSFCRVEHCVMAGHSMGGYVALEFARHYPQMLKGMVLLNSKVDGDNEQAIQNRERAIENIKTNGKGFLDQFIPGLFTSDNRQKLSKEIEELKSRAASISDTGLIASLAGMNLRQDQRDLLSETKIPVLFIVGKQDPRIPFEKALGQIALPMHAEAVILNDVGHMSFFEAPETTRKAIRDFTKRAYNI